MKKKRLCEIRMHIPKCNTCFNEMGLIICIWLYCGLPRRLCGKESACQCRRHGFHLWVGKIPWRRKWQPTLVFLPGESHGQRSLVGYRARVAQSRNDGSNLARTHARNGATQSTIIHLPLWVAFSKVLLSDHQFAAWVLWAWNYIMRMKLFHKFFKK